MKATTVSAIVFANVLDERVGELTAMRSSASLPFGSSYRLIDFSLCNLVNADINNIGIITKENYRSLMDHLGSGVYWDLDRKNGGLHILPPFNNANAVKYTGYIDALNGAKNFITRCKSDYIVICDANVVANIDLSAAIETHIKNEADVTMLWRKAMVDGDSAETMAFSFSNDNDIQSITVAEPSDEAQCCGFGFYVINTDVLLNLVDLAYKNGLYDLKLAFFADSTKQLKIIGFEHTGYLSVIDSQKKYYDANMDLLNIEVRKCLFNNKRPVFTKTRDDMPTRYGTHAVVQNCSIGDGCIIEGTVKNSVLFRGVKVEKGAVVENSIVMQSGVIEKNAEVKYAILDKNVCVGESKVLKGTADSELVIGKSKKI